MKAPHPYRSPASSRAPPQPEGLSLTGGLEELRHLSLALLLPFLRARLSAAGASASRQFTSGRAEASPSPGRPNPHPSARAEQVFPPSTRGAAVSQPHVGAAGRLPSPGMFRAACSARAPHAGLTGRRRDTSALWPVAARHALSHTLAWVGTPLGLGAPTVLYQDGGRPAYGWEWSSQTHPDV
jgi:hypothetical protein